MTLKEEAEQLAKDRPTSLSDDLYQWAMDAEEMLWKLSAQAAQPAQNEWKEAVIEQLAAHSMDAPVSDSPTVILAKIIHMAVLQATDPAIKVAQPAQVPEVEPVAWVLFRKDEDGLEPIQFYGGKDKPEGEFKDRFELRSVHLAPPDTEAGNMVQQPAQMPDYREIADCVLAGLEDRNGVLNLDVDADIEEEIRQEVADNIRMMLAAAPSTKEGQQ